MTSSAPLDFLIIIGTGFMGASIAQAAKRRGIAQHVFGIDSRSAQQAVSLGQIDAQAESLAQLPQLCLQFSSQEDRCAIAIVIASPVSTYGEIFSELSSLPSALKPHQSITWITDIGSTKSGVLRAANRLGSLASVFVSSHPMAGSEKHGPADARADLFQSARVLISRLPQSTNDVVAAVEGFWITLGGQPSLLP
ncbi:MAG: prephenate dehydrogenase/arogenate dehydrogenase family protein, partial [Betaproteobacteria bacterium]|nr:prephenate dehydrogenase/arogenate dehydrogenase family protein [Betaproteobacteria bacterium]